MRRIAALVILVFLGSCTTARIPTEKPGSLHEVNERLSGRWAVISKTDGRIIRNVRDVAVGHTHTRYLKAGTTKRDSVMTSEIQWVALPSRGIVGPNTLVLASPGLVVMGLGLAALAGADSESESMAAGIVGYSFTFLGAGAAVLGAVIGAAVGVRAAENRPVVVYLGPISQYPARP